MLPFAQTTAPHRFERFPALEEYPALLAAYAEHESELAGHRVSQG
jgi:hypothetical protein